MKYKDLISLGYDDFNFIFKDYISDGIIINVDHNSVNYYSINHIVLEEYLNYIINIFNVQKITNDINNGLYLMEEEFLQLINWCYPEKLKDYEQMLFFIKIFKILEKIKKSNNILKKCTQKIEL